MECLLSTLTRKLCIIRAVMSEPPKAGWWKASLAGGVIFGFLYPLIIAVLDVIRANARRDYSLALTDAARMWVYGVVYFGLPAFVLGCGCGILLMALGLKCSTMKVAVMVAAALGLALGEVPLGVIALVDRASGIIWAYAVAGTAGIVCALLVLRLLHRSGLLRFRARGEQQPPLA